MLLINLISAFGGGKTEIPCSTLDKNRFTVLTVENNHRCFKQKNFFSQHNQPMSN